ncbi:hypothetical protein BC830DRAFT_1145199 [Chytriomyces sp. MP71]|nr:hypothetical protein BC830DRAFT_1145199 [Chytriomyces sp. MP71]
MEHASITYAQPRQDLSQSPSAHYSQHSQLLVPQDNFTPLQLTAFGCINTNSLSNECSLLKDFASLLMPRASNFVLPNPLEQERHLSIVHSSLAVQGFLTPQWHSHAATSTIPTSYFPRRSTTQVHLSHSPLSPSAAPALSVPQITFPSPPLHHTDAPRLRTSQSSACPKKKGYTRIPVPRREKALLKRLFEEDMYPSTTRIHEIAQRVGLEARKIRIWYQVKFGLGYFLGTNVHIWFRIRGRNIEGRATELILFTFYS